MGYKLKLSVITFGSNLFTSFIGLYVLILIEETYKSVLFNGLFGDLSKIVLILVVLFIGPWIEKQIKKKVMLLAFIVISVFLIPEAYFIHTHYFFLTLLLLDIIMAFFIDINDLSKSTYLKLMIEEEKLQEVLGSIGAAATLGTLAGTIGAAFLYGAVNLTYVMVIGLGIFLLNSLLMATLPKDHTVTIDKKNHLQLIKAGFNYIKASRPLLNLISIIVIYNACSAVVTSLIIFYWGSIDKGFGDTLMIFEGIGLGVGLGMVWVNVKKNYQYPLFSLLILSIINGASIISLGFVKEKMMFSFMAGVFFFTLIVISPIARTMRIKMTAADYNTRVVSIINLCSAVLSVAIILIFATLSDVLKLTYFPYFSAGSVTIISVMIFYYKDKRFKTLHSEQETELVN